MSWVRNNGSRSALEITSGQELERFDLGTFKLRGTDCPILTGHEDQEGLCRFCGKPIEKGKRRASYCRGRSHNDFESCFRQYWNHFEWASASSWALRRAGHKCENCGCEEIYIQWGYDARRSNLEVHHIVPLKGEARYFSAFNLPWNLIILCHECHKEVHAVMNRKPLKIIPVPLFDYAGVKV